MALKQLLVVRKCQSVFSRYGSSAVSVPSTASSASSASVNRESASEVIVDTSKVDKTRLDKFATYHRVPVQSADPRISSGLVLLLPWTLAKDAHVAKFESYYLKKGFNVLTVHTPTRHLLLSHLYRKKLKTVAEELQNPSSIKPFSKMLVHAFSIGHFALGQLLVEMDKVGHQVKKIPTSVVLDSAFDYRTLILALVRTFPLPIKAQDSLHPLCDLLWMKLIPGLGVKPNEKVYDRIHKEKFDRALVLTSQVDPIGTADYSTQLMQLYRVNGTKVQGKIFESSPHVMHFVKYQKEYLQLLEPFVKEFIRKN